jgi:hypothetical protein
MRRIDLTGQKFGRLTVIKYDHTGNPPRYEAFWNCQCECGKITTITYGHLKFGHTQSCGCLHSETVSKRNTGNTVGRKYSDPKLATANHIWQITYRDGCSFEKFLELSQQPCHYCGELPFITFNKYKAKDGRYISDVIDEWADRSDFTYNGLDRVDSSRDHSEDNIVPCCIICNRAKHAMTSEQFLTWIEKAFNHSIKNRKAE